MGSEEREKGRGWGSAGAQGRKAQFSWGFSICVARPRFRSTRTKGIKQEKELTKLLVSVEERRDRSPDSRLEGSRDSGRGGHLVRRSGIRDLRN